MLRAIGIHVEEAANGRVAIEALGDRKFDVVLMDCEMPDMDGFETTRWIREAERKGKGFDQKSTSMPIIALTAQALQEDRQRCLDAGMNDYLSKPIDRESLVAKLSIYLDATAVGVDRSPRVRGQSGAAEASAFDGAIEMGELRERCGGNEEIVDRVLRMFSQQAKEQTAALDQALRANDRRALRSIAHNLRGSAANVSAIEVSDAAAKLVRAASRQDNQPDFSALVSTLERAMQTCLQEIDAMRSF
jgi:CheY-like chemotaxis protein